MARTELPNGVILPAEYSDDWYEDMTSNLTKLDDVIGSDSEKLNSNDVAFLRMSSAALTDGGTGNFSDLNSSNKLKTGDYVLDSGRKLYQVVSVDSTNETFTVGNSLFKITAESDLAPVAESGDYDDLDNKPDLNPYDQHIVNTDIHVTTADKNKWNNGVTQSYVFRYSGTAVVPNSTIAYSTIDNTDNIKSGDKILDVDGKLFEITAVDATNQTVTVGSALIDLALDANVVHTAEINSSGIGIIEAVKEVGGVDFNTLTTQGLYGANASGSTNNPENSPCVVQVIKRLNSVIQIANVSSSAYKSRYIRYCADITAQPPVWQSWIKFATDDNVMHLSGNETASGIKDFSGILRAYNSDSSLNTAEFWLKNSKVNRGQAVYGDQGLWFRDATDKRVTAIISRITSNGASALLLYAYNENQDNQQVSNYLSFIKYLDGTCYLLPDQNDAIEMGSSTAKFKSINTNLINGINPGSLSMPDLNNGIDISGYVNVSQVSQYTALADGYISIACHANSTNVVCIKDTSYDYGTVIRAYQPSSVFELYAVIPVIKNHTYNITFSGTAAITLDYAKFFPCQGNV